VKLKAVIHEGYGGGFWAEIPALPGCCAQGRTREEMLANLKEAAEGSLACGLGGPAETVEITE
jgi:predicted RNase H-like HicB family nuclease